MHLKSKKGYDIKLSGNPSKIVEELPIGKKIKLHPTDFSGIKPRLLVSEGDYVKQGQPVYFDKKNPNVMFTSYASGIVNKIQYGDRRSILSIEICVQESDDEITFTHYDDVEIQNLEKNIVKEVLCISGLWPAIRRRPFSKIAIPGTNPRSIFINTCSTAPYAPNIQVINKNINFHDLQAGINALYVMTNASIHMVIPQSEELADFNNLNNVQLHTFSGPHPAGNVGYHISNIDPIESKETNIWYIHLQDIAVIGKLFLSGKVENKKFVSIGGSPMVDDNRHVKINRGTLLSDIICREELEKKYRIISGDVLVGENVAFDSAVGYYQDIISIVKNRFDREFLGWLNPGINKFSLSNTFLSNLFKKQEYKCTTSMNGGVRTIIPIGLIEKMCLLDVMPSMLLKSIIAQDIEMMDELGIYECDAEDFGLCAFVDASKMDIISIIQNGLDYIEQEG